MVHMFRNPDMEEPMIVSDFDGTITVIPKCIDLSKCLGSGNDYIDMLPPNEQVIKYFKGCRVIILTGRDNPIPIARYCLKHKIPFARIICSDKGIFQRYEHAEAIAKMRAKKKEIIERLQPDMYFDDDLPMIQLLQINGHKIYVH